MKREPDWEALHQVNFILANRIGTSLNAALNAIKLSEMPESKLDPQIWRDRAKAAVANVLNLYEAWSALIQFKNGFSLPPNAIRAFPVQSLLDWLTVQMELMPPPRAKNNIQLRGNQASFQEAVLLLYSVGATQGSSVHLNLELTNSGSWFRIRFMRSTTLPESVDELVASFGDHWRNQDTTFELKTARDFVLLNGSELILKWDKDARMGEFAFFVPSAVVGIPRRTDEELVPVAQEADSVARAGKSQTPSAVEAVAEMNTAETRE
ncbi:MAG TPA: hypothetical protein VJZ27_11925, partial [Aggregatilineales bacterium]|nr:hypothetical protein [Aggregatilineales bacterium]